MKIGFYISGTGTRLQHFLLEARQDEIKDIEIVVSDYPISEDLANTLSDKNIQSVIIEYDALPGNGNKEKNLVLSNMILKVFCEYKIDYCFSFGSHILSGKLLDMYKNKIINFHPSLLPMYPGRNSIDQAINHGNTFLLGNTAHFIDSGVDTGPVIMQSVIPTKAFYDSDNNYNVVLDIQIMMLHKLFWVIKNDAIYINENGSVSIIGGEYHNYAIFPSVSKLSDS